MLTSCKLTGGAAKLAAYHSSEENYYFAQAAGVEALGGEGGGGPRVHGGLAETLGFKEGAVITERDLRNLLSSRNAAGELVAREHQVIGVDLTFSAPKSVSVAGLLTDRDPSIIAAHDRAVLDTMREIERHCGETRRRDKGGPPLPFHTGNMAYVTVRDGFNREHDPHLHTHVVVMNMTRLGGEILSLNGRRILRHDFNKLWGSMYRAKLAANLREAGHSVSYTKKGELRLDSVSLEVEREFSKRRAEIVAAKKDGLHDMAAWRKTRKEKDPKVEKVNVLEDWQARAEQYQTKTVEQNKADVRAERQTWAREAAFSIEAQQELSGERGNTEAARWQAAARRATERTATVTANAIITEYLTELARGEAWAPITYATAEQRLRAEVSAGRLLATDDGRYTTWELTRADRECVRDRQAPAVLALKAEEAAAQVKEYVRTSLKQGQRGLSEQQAAAAAGILSAERGTVVVQGDAGAGKTTMLKAVHEIAGKKGWEIVGLSIQGVAARKLQEESGINSMTVSSYLARERAVGRVEPGETPAARAPRLIVIDEASMNDSRGLAELMSRADKHGDKVVLVGDRNQIQSVGAGRPFDRLVETAEASGQLLSLSENYRQRNKELREAVDLARDGKMRESIDILSRTGRVTEIPGRDLRRVAVAALYDKDTLILAGSRESRDALNALIREDLAKRGVVDRSAAHTYKLAWADADGARRTVSRELAKGDVVTFLKNDYRKDFDVRNGERGEVLSTSKDGLTVRLEDGRKVEVDIKQYGALDYGYAMTTYKAQGQTYDKVVVEADTSVPVLQDYRNTYVQITRARDDVRVFTDDKAELREAAGVLNNRVDTFGVDATLEKAAAMERRVQAEVFGNRARSEAAAKIHQVEAAAKHDAEKIAEAGRSKFAPPENPHVYNERYVMNAKAAEQAARIDRLREIDAALQVRKDMNDGEKRWTAEYLNSAEAAKILEKFKTTEEVIAVGMYKGRVTDLDEAVKGLSANQKAAVKIHVQNEKIERKREQELDARSKRGAEKIADGPIVVSNNDYLARAADSEELTRGYERHLAAVTEKLRGAEMFNEAEKRDIAAELAKSESARVLYETIGRSEDAVAFAAVRSGVADVARAARALPTADVEEIKDLLENAAPKDTRVYNDLFVARADAEKQGERVARMRDIDAQLQARTDLSAGDKGYAAEYLNSDEGAKALEQFKHPEQVIAVGLYKSHVMGLKEAVKGLPIGQQMSVETHVWIEEAEKRRELEKSREKDNGKDRGLDLSL